VAERRWIRLKMVNDTFKKKMVLYFRLIDTISKPASAGLGLN